MNSVLAVRDYDVVEPIHLFTMRMEVEGAFRIAGRGLILTGIPDQEPRQGPALIWFKTGETAPITIVGIERKLIPANWWRVGVGLMVQGDDLVQMTQEDLYGCCVEQAR